MVKNNIVYNKSNIILFNYEYDGKESIERKHHMKNNTMPTYLHEEMLNNYKILILYILKDLKIIELRRIIWEKIFTYEEENEPLNVYD